MPEPTSSDDSFDEFGDLDIERLLASDKQDYRNLGLVLLDFKKRDKYCGALRIWSNERDWGLSGADIAEIWEAVLSSIHRRIEERRFEETGKLRGYIRTIAIRRAIDFLRRSIRIDHAAKVHWETIKRVDQRHEPPDPKFIEIARARFLKLAKNEKLVATYDLRLFYRARGQRWTSPRELTAIINKGRRNKLTVAAVRSARARGRRKLGGDDI